MLMRGTVGVLVLGFGNPSRRDDGLGVRLAEAIVKLQVRGVVVDCDYQLQVEDAVLLAEHRVVIFADADAACEAPFRFQRVEPRTQTEFTTHELSPAALLGLARQTLGAVTRGYLLAIRGQEFDRFEEGLSPQAEENLRAAVAFLTPLLRSGRFEEHCMDPVPLGQHPRG